MFSVGATTFCVIAAGFDATSKGIRRRVRLLLMFFIRAIIDIFVVYASGVLPRLANGFFVNDLNHCIVKSTLSANALSAIFVSDIAAVSSVAERCAQSIAELAGVE
jgi:hypothetical protein